MKRAEEISAEVKRRMVGAFHFARLLRVECVEVARADEDMGDADLEPSGYKYLCQVSFVLSAPSCPEVSHRLTLSSSSSVSERPRGTLSSSSSTNTSSSAGPGAGKAFLSCVWDPNSDAILSEVYQNVRLIALTST